ncbi:hypothetical protein KIN20_025364 [Parelaphostrongylus tenuis]|uniref:Uncharacterized protein n=1 Tax=Parelaphostrongylus tenuis TaxID=148309 RepID=A0AAD5N978_PARTN|nr:hypothetical protein KIN20_025364 [Parelaphostrongylus tenuis]
MNIFAGINGHRTGLILFSLLATILTASGCGAIPAGQACKRTFTVTGIITLSVAMVYVGKAEISTRVSGIATNQWVEGTKGLVERLVMHTMIFNFKFQALHLTGAASRKIRLVRNEKGHNEDDLLQAFTRVMDFEKSRKRRTVGRINFNSAVSYCALRKKLEKKKVASFMGKYVRQYQGTVMTLLLEGSFTKL